MMLRGEEMSVAETVNAEHISNVIVVSDTHCGCRMGLCPPEVSFDDGGGYTASPLQLKTWAWWTEFWDEWVPHITRGQPYAVVVNGDMIEGRHHNATTQISANLADQSKIAESVFGTIVQRCDKRFYVVRGTEAHTGPSAETEEALAGKLDAVPDELGNHSRWELWMRIGGRSLVHFLHQIGTTSSAHYEATALTKELNETYLEAAKWALEPPAAVVRSHRHRDYITRINTHAGYAYCIVTAAWQLKTPLTHRMAMSRTSAPTIGGLALIQGDEDFYPREKVWKIDRPREVTI
ncbi:MAG TPA: hypothetical protein VNA25_06630 [Phycisphaerae bacterium]|nr:hypothetical protein [Phycisphaerae bacterium]